MSRKENIEKKLSALTCQDESNKFYSALSQVYKNENIMLASDGHRAGMYFLNNNNSDCYKSLPAIETREINAIQRAIQMYEFDSAIDINRKMIKDVITNQMSDIKAQYKPHYNCHKDILKLTTGLSFGIDDNVLHVNTMCHLSKLSRSSNIKTSTKPAYDKQTFISNNTYYPDNLLFLPAFVYNPRRFNNKIINITFDTNYLLDLINFHTEDTLQIMLLDDKLGVNPIMSIQDDRLMLLIPCYPSRTQEDEK